MNSGDICVCNHAKECSETAESCRHKEAHTYNENDVTCKEIMCRVIDKPTVCIGVNNDTKTA